MDENDENVSFTQIDLLGKLLTDAEKRFGGCLS